MRRRRALGCLFAVPLLASGLAVPPRVACARSRARCDVSGLSPEERRRRAALQYSDRSPRPPQACGNCMHLQPTPARNGDACKACSVLPGPVHIEGGCTAWVARVGGAG